MFHYFSLSFFLSKQNQKRNWRRETKTDNEKWKLIEEEQEIRKTNYVKIFFRSRQKEKQLDGIQKPKFRKQTKGTLFWKKLSKKEIGKKRRL